MAKSPTSCVNTEILIFRCDKETKQVLRDLCRDDPKFPTLSAKLRNLIHEEAFRKLGK